MGGSQDFNVKTSAGLFPSSTRTPDQIEIVVTQFMNTKPRVLEKESCDSFITLRWGIGKVSLEFALDLRCREISLENCRFYPRRKSVLRKLFFSTILQEPVGI